MSKLSRGRLFGVGLISFLSAHAWASDPVSGLFLGTRLADPPAQHAPWKIPSTHLPASVVEASVKLFDQGLPDPRGCEYREVEIIVGSVWGGFGKFKTHAWVIPGQAGETERFAVTWSGLVYPVVSIGAKASIRADAEPELMVHEHVRDTWRRAHPRVTFQYYPIAVPESVSSSFNVVALRIPQLLRLGETALAEKVWAALKEQYRRPQKGRAARDPYVDMAEEWTWALFDRAVCAHMRGDDHMALLSLRMLAAVQPAIQAEAANRNCRQNGADCGATQTDLLSFPSLPGLLADQERRAREPEETSSSPGVLTMGRLIESLEEVAGRQFGQPGGFVVDDDPVFQALVAKGEDAVEPLIDVVENDNRLTRTVTFSRDFFRDRTILTVAHLAELIIADILGVSLGNELKPSLAGDERRRELAKRLRQYWARYKDLTPMERWYRTLGDDGAPASEWVQAARLMVRPVDIKKELGTWDDTSYHPPVERMQGEVLRDKREPSVTGLLEQRIVALGRTTNETTSQAHELVIALLKWDKPAGLAALRAEMNDCMAQLSAASSPASLRKTSCSDIVRDTIERAKAGDLTALDQYARWLRSLRIEKDAFGYPTEMLQPLWAYYDYPAIQEVSQWAFLGDNSPWNPLFFNTKIGSIEQFYNSALINLAAFRQQLIRSLADRTPMGKVEVIDVRNVSYRWNSGGGGVHSMIDPDGAPSLPVGTEQELRVCDHVAWVLSQIQGSPRFAQYWSTARRDQAITAYIAWLQQFKANSGR